MWSPCDGLVINWSHVIVTVHEKWQGFWLCDDSQSWYFLCFYCWVPNEPMVIYLFKIDLWMTLYHCQQHRDMFLCRWVTSKYAVFCIILCIAIWSLNLSKILIPSVVLPSPFFHKYNETIWRTTIVIYTCFVYLSSYLSHILVHPSYIMTARLTDWLKSQLLSQ